MRIVKMGISEYVDSGESGCYIVVQHLDAIIEIPVGIDMYSRLKEMLDGAPLAPKYECEGDLGRAPLEVSRSPVEDDVEESEEDDGVPQV